MAHVGEDIEGRFLIEFQTPQVIPVDASDKRYLHDKIADAFVDRCVKAGVRPENTIIDVSGEGQGVFEEICRKWGTEAVNQCEFGGAASERLISPKRGLKANEMYANRVTELWYEARRFAIGDQLRGLDDDTLQELCSRKRGERLGRKIKIESKEDMKKRGLRSPDAGDAVVLMCELVQMKGKQPVAGRATHDKKAWSRFYRKRRAGLSSGYGRQEL